MHSRYNSICFRNLLVFLLYMLISICLSSGNYEVCDTTGNFTANSTYARNLNLLLSSLASNITVNGGFYNTSIGQDPNKVYGLALCRADVYLEDCGRCVDSTSQKIKTACPSQKAAFMWDGTPACLVRFADSSFFGRLETDVQINSFTNIKNITMNLTEFDQIWQPLMDNTAKEASEGSSRLKFATKEANLTRIQTIYALMQCTPDLSQSDCYFCLTRYVAEYTNCCHGKQGGGVESPNCMFRWDLYPFYKVVSPFASPPPAPSTITSTDGERRERKENRAWIAVVTPISAIIAIVLLGSFVWHLCRRTKRDKDVDEIETESLQFDFSTIKAATNDFPDDNKLGQGGFGAVYKGRLPNGQDIAVKRLSINSGQGDLEFKNEVLLVAKLQHRNLVRLLGFCLEGRERLLIYEFVPNSSLDNFIFDPIKRGLLKWETRYKIIWGIARGILYLHEDSRLRIIHRDLKASNILLDVDMNPKISDFGMARLFEMDETQGNTSRVVGTFGYMAPEYVKHGQFSVKSDVFSFGVLVLEIICGRKNSCFVYEEKTVDLLTYAWKNWKEGTALNMMDPTLRVGSTSEIMRCIHIGLLCVQENVASRPTMALVVVMLTSSSISLSVPSKPAFYMHSRTELNNSKITGSDQSRSHSVQFSKNEVSITELEPR